MDKLNIPTKSTSQQLAVNLLTETEKTQELLTQKAFKHAPFSGVPQNKTLEEFISDYQNNVQKNSFPDTYNGYYDNKNPLDVRNKVPNDEVLNSGFQSFFSDEKLDLIYEYNSLESDMEAIKQISQGQTGVKRFEYDGVKYKWTKAKSIYEKLEYNKKALLSEIEENDVAIYQYFKELSGGDGRFDRLNSEFFEYQELLEQHGQTMEEFWKKLEFVQFTLPVEEIRAKLRALEQDEENLKNGIRELINDEAISDFLGPGIKENFDKYLSEKCEYFGLETYHVSNLEMLYMAIQDYSFLYERRFFTLKKRLLEYQNGLL